MKTSPLTSSSSGLQPLSSAAARAERVRRVHEASDRFRTDVETRHGGYGRFEPRWANPVIDDPQTMAQMTQPRGAFLAQLIAQEVVETSANADDRIGPATAYRRAAYKLVEIRTGATVDVAA
jgi:hypothetical protein